MGKQPSLEQYREDIVQLLADRGNDQATLGGNEPVKNFEQMGAPSSGHWPLTAEAIKRAFGVRDKRAENPDESEYIESLEAASFALLEMYLANLKEGAHILWDAVTTVYPRDEGGHRDYDYYRERAAKGNPEAKSVLLRCDWGIDLMAMAAWKEGSDLFVRYARARTAREEKEAEDTNATIAADYEDRKLRIAEKEAAKIVGDRWGISESSVRRIAEGQRVAAGEEKRSPGRPRKSA